MLWPDLKQAIHTQNISNVIELKQFCKEGVTLSIWGQMGHPWDIELNALVQSSESDRPLTEK